MMVLENLYLELWLTILEASFHEVTLILRNVNLVLKPKRNVRKVRIRNNFIDLL